MRVPVFVIAALLALCLVCAASGQSQAATNPNVLTPAESAAGWRLLFDGQSLDGWRSFRKAAVVADRWAIEDHCLHLYRRGGERRVGGDLMSREMFGNFEFAFEWKAGPGVNSGVKYLVDEYLAPNPNPVSFEYQIQVEEDPSKPRRQPLHSTGALYDMLPPQGGILRPEGSFNESRIVVRGAQVEHWLNGEKLLEFNREAPEFRALVARSKFAKWAGFGLNGRGHITLQDHGGEVYFRRLRVLALPRDGRTGDGARQSQ
ncbi:MAG: DUF1080 domain-containing protein [Bryobacterales bacterium]|jgi:hypothetical protein|nr:DUF1080 domain-containing protein [Bryobacterales bacterium]